MHKRPKKQSPAKPLPAQKPRAVPSEVPTHWADVAHWYDHLVGDSGSDYHQHVILPGILRMLSPPSITDKPRPLHILDLACGQGVLCRKLASLGHHLTGIDAAEPLIAAAQRRDDIDKLSIRYAVADATKLLPDDEAAKTGAKSGGKKARDSGENSDRGVGGNLAAGLTPNSFDAITCILAIQNMSPLSPIWQACKTLLKPTGTGGGGSVGGLIIVMMHPCFRIPQHSDWTWENTGSGGVGAQGRTIYQYLSSTTINIQTHPGKAAHGKSDQSTPHFHRPLQAYINTLGNAGLLIDHIEEWISHKTSQPGPKKAALDKSRKEIPMFLALRARRI